MDWAVSFPQKDLSILALFFSESSEFFFWIPYSHFAFFDCKLFASVSPKVLIWEKEKDFLVIKSPLNDFFSV
eukprot:NODE_20809_length_781_cov_4.966361.p2 GENE.NODE_20809_length_781_cov_4.966361~~NODE_20809_length_781_cov_4.966361.p2  ORF type:complete len:72 (+),score=1.53 NODE_20809_length_781_cov_4.966361:199-414(+)